MNLHKHQLYFMRKKKQTINTLVSQC